MKSFALFKIRVILVGLAVILALSPACKAQSEIAPGHFDGDGTDARETRTHNVAPLKSQRVLAATQVNHHDPHFRAALHFTAKGQSSTPVRHDTAAIVHRRKAVANKSKKQ